MPLNFPNASRSYDTSRRSVRFWGHDGAVEVPFFLEAEALLRLARGSAPDEATALRLFDTHHERIQKAARTAYARRRQGAYSIGAAEI